MYTTLLHLSYFDYPILSGKCVIVFRYYFDGDASLTVMCVEHVDSDYMIPNQSSYGTYIHEAIVQGVPEKAGMNVCVHILKHTSCTFL